MAKGKRDPEQRKERVRARIEQSGNLPTLPGVVVARIVEMVDDERTTARQPGAEIAKDQVVSAKVLKLVNSGHHPGVNGPHSWGSQGCCSAREWTAIATPRCSVGR